MLCPAVLASTTFVSGEAFAEVPIIQQGGWELFTDGRVDGFVSYAKGDGFPVTTATQVPFGGGINANMATQIADPMHPEVQPTIESMRIRSGFLGNILGVGLRKQLSENVRMTAYFQLWSDIETEAQRKYLPMPVDVREGFLKIEGPAGEVTVGRQLTLFSRGAAQIDFLYGHGFALGFPGNISSNGPAAGHIGTGVMGPGFAAGVVYATPSFGGLQLTAGLFDPVVLQGAWDRTKYVRPEAEFTYDLEFGSNARLHIFANGVWQRVYKQAQPDENFETVLGGGYGARLEAGPVHLGVAGHYGKGLGLYYALETSEAAYDESYRLRTSDGYYAQSQFVLGDFDLNAGIGVSRVYELPTDGVPDVNGVRRSVIDYQLGISGVIVYHISQTLHAAVDYFRANYKWHLGEKQNVNFVNAGLTAVW
jgi:hypothetical protein